jgi:hypothetical protein
MWDDVHAISEERARCLEHVGRCEEVDRGSLRRPFIASSRIHVAKLWMFSLTLAI